jgi:hypothetical protein
VTNTLAYFGSPPVTKKNVSYIDSRCPETNENDVTHKKIKKGVTQSDKEEAKVKAKEDKKKDKRKIKHRIGKNADYEEKDITRDDGVTHFENDDDITRDNNDDVERDDDDVVTLDNEDGWITRHDEDDDGVTRDDAITRFNNNQNSLEKDDYEGVTRDDIITRDDDD